MYNSPFSTNSTSSSNPFALPGPMQSAQNLDNSIMETYAKLNALKQRQAELNSMVQGQPVMQQQMQRTVFSDIATEMSDLGEDELNFIVSSNEYRQLNERHQREFSEFITEKFSNEYIATGRTKTLEQLLAVIRKRKEEYKSRFASDITEIREQNKSLVDKNNELAQSNAELQKQLEIIQQKLKGL